MKKNRIVYFILFALLIFILGYEIHQETEEKYLHMKSDFVGTYKVSEANHEYIAVLRDVDENGHTYYRYSENDFGRVSDKGIAKATDNNFILFNDVIEGDNFTIVYDEESYFLIENNDYKKIEKISDEPITSEYCK